VTSEGELKMTGSRVLLLATMVLALARCGTSSTDPGDLVDPAQDVADARVAGEVAGETDISASDTAPEVVAHDETNAIFDAHRLVQIEIEIAPEDWQLLRAEGRGLATRLEPGDDVSGNFTALISQ
jgi:hypothetical protein